MGITGAELFWSLLIGWTCSRGALVAWSASLAVFGLLKIKSLSLRSREGAVFWAVSLGCLATALLTTGTGERFLEIADGDRSAWNRLGIWSDALKLIHAAPLTGWGAGQSGNALVHWFAPLDSTKEYAAVVGTYLHIGAEFGLPVLTLIFAVLSITLLVGFHAERKATGRQGGLLSMCIVGLIGFLTAGLFSTLWVNVITSGVVPLFVVLIWFIAWRNRGITMRKVIGGLTAALALSLAIYVAAGLLTLREGCTIKKISGGVLITKRSVPKDAGEAVFFVDGLVLGTFYGKPVRRITENMDRWRTIQVSTGPFTRQIKRETEVFVFGARIAEIPKDILSKATIVAPTTAYLHERYGVPLSVLLPEYDEFGHAAGWLNGVKSKGGDVQVINETGQDCSGQTSALIRLFRERSG